MLFKSSLFKIKTNFEAFSNFRELYMENTDFWNGHIKKPIYINLTELRR